MIAEILPFNSYLLLPEKQGLPERLATSFISCIDVSGFNIYHNCTDQYYVKVDEDPVEAVVLGHVYNPFSGVVGQAAIAAVMAKYSSSMEGFYDELDELSGRFVLFVFNNDGRLEVFSDSCSSLPVNYFLSLNGLVLSSHACLIRDSLGLSVGIVTKELSRTRFYNFGIRHCPADLTEVEGVRLLTPNLYLTYKYGSFIINRVFPRSCRYEWNVEEVVAEVSRVLLRAVDCLVQFDKPIHCALSGGVDSRMTLAAAVNQRDKFHFFTFAGEGNASRDLLCTKELSQRLPMSFEEIHLSRDQPTDEFRSRYHYLQGETRVPNVQETFARHQHFGVNDAFEVRSSISEVARNFMRRKFHVDALPLTADAMVPLYKRVPFSRKWHKMILQEFESWMALSNFKDIEFYGYDWLDFYYWEFRVGTWQALVLQDADYYTNPTVLFNNRKLLNLMLSTAERYRKDDLLQVMIMERLDKESLQLPIVKNFGKKAKFREFLESRYLKLYRAFISA